MSAGGPGVIDHKDVFVLHGIGVIEVESVFCDFSSTCRLSGGWSSDDLAVRVQRVSSELCQRVSATPARRRNDRPGSDWLADCGLDAAPVQRTRYAEKKQHPKLALVSFAGRGGVLVPKEQMSRLAVMAAVRHRHH